MVIELNRRLIKGYTHFKDHPRIVQLKKSVTNYNKQLRLLGLRDHQVEYAKFSIIRVVSTLIYRLTKLTLLAIGTLPGLILFAPVFVATKLISKKKSEEALAASTVKLQGRDVMATWKLLVALAFAPAVYAFYTTLFTYWTYRNRIQGYVPEWVPLWAVILLGVLLFPTITFAALRIGEIGMDIVKSLRPLVLSLNPSSANTLVKLRKRRAELSHELTEAVNTLGPELFPDFDSARIVADPFKEYGNKVDSEHKSSDESATKYTTQEPLPRNESFHDLAKIGFFSTRPASRSRSRSATGPRVTGSIKPLSEIDGKDRLDEVSKRIRGAMRERGQERRRRSEDFGWENVSAGSITPPEDGEKKNM
jgi:glycerol-3-phosphate O-acyltransferase / dihydroxyacetone phosphate acyltransferase